MTSDANEPLRPRIKLVLDVSAVTEYSTNASVGELLIEINEGDPEAVFAMSSGTLAQAYGAGVAETSLRLLLQHPSCVVVNPFNDWGAFGRYLRDFPSDNVHDAYLIYLAFRNDGYVFTNTPDPYLKSNPEAPIVFLEEPFEGGP